MTSAVARAHTNIALVKYWGKRDSELMLPQTDSLSLTLNEFYTDTKVEFSAQLTADELIIDGQPVSGKGLKKSSKSLVDRASDESDQSVCPVESINHVPMASRSGQLGFSLCCFGNGRQFGCRSETGAP